MKQAQGDKMQQLLACRARLVRLAAFNPRMLLHTGTASACVGPNPAKSATRRYRTKANATTLLQL
eukprot:COSAG02_NODE_43204_length_377_cov_0.705036_1_plen_65_part_10